nr:MAG TPA: hypothetical protein [Bacteriophage sp.]
MDFFVNMEMPVAAAVRAAAPAFAAVASPPFSLLASASAFLPASEKPLSTPLSSTLIFTNRSNKFTLSPHFLGDFQENARDISINKAYTFIEGGFCHDQFQQRFRI